MMDKEACEQVIAGLTKLILSGRTMLGNEQYNPRANVDASDADIEEYRQRVKELREIRERFENLMTGGLE